MRQNAAEQAKSLWPVEEPLTARKLVEQPFPNGAIVGWGGPEQRKVEENLFKRFNDAFRQLHGYPREEWSWIARNGQWRRFDHVLYRGLRPSFAAERP